MLICALSLKYGHMVLQPHGGWDADDLAYIVQRGSQTKIVFLWPLSFEACGVHAKVPLLMAGSLPHVLQNWTLLLYKVKIDLKKLETYIYSHFLFLSQYAFASATVG